MIGTFAFGPEAGLVLTVVTAVVQGLTVSALQLHRHFVLVCDEPALQELKVKTVKYFTELEGRAIHSVL